MTVSAPTVLARCRALVEPALRATVDELENPLMRRIAAYQLGWCDAHGRPIEGGGGKAIRPTLAVLSAQAAGASAEQGVPAGVAVELVHNFSLLHDDIMDRDVERRHRPTGWVAFGDAQALLAGNAMLTAAVQVLDGPGAHRCVPALLSAVQELISGQSEDVELEGRAEVDLQDVLRMEAGKTAALLSCSASLGAVAVGAPPSVVTGLAGFGHELGMAFQLVDDILGIAGDERVTGKSSSSDVRAGKRSAPIVAALQSGTSEGAQLGRLLAGGAPKSEDDVVRAAGLVRDAGGLDWATREAGRRLALALGALADLRLPAGPGAELVELARYVVERDL
jgi:geranylgeranyl diphosphate synthase type I